jgi:hypothetical protein
VTEGSDQEELQVHQIPYLSMERRHWKEDALLKCIVIEEGLM